MLLELSYVYHVILYIIGTNNEYIFFNYFTKLRFLLKKYI